MRTTHTLNATRALFISGALLIVAGLAFAFAPLSQVAAARQALVARANANPTIGKILSLAPAPVRSVIQKRLAQPALKAAGVAAPAAMMAVGGITLEATPATGSFVGQQQPLNVIAYTIIVTNDGGADLEGPGGTSINVTFNAPPGTLLQNLAVIEQPQALSADWTCPGFVNGAATLTCSPNGAGNGLFSGNQTVRIRVEAAVQANTPTGTFLIARANYTQVGNGAQNINSNETQHVVNPFADLHLDDLLAQLLKGHGRDFAHQAPALTRRAWNVDRF